MKRTCLTTPTHRLQLLLLSALDPLLCCDSSQFASSEEALSEGSAAPRQVPLLRTAQTPGRQYVPGRNPRDTEPPSTGRRLVLAPGHARPHTVTACARSGGQAVR